MAGSGSDGLSLLRRRPCPGPSLLEHFAALEDPRQRAKALHPLPDILLLLLSATLAGADDCAEIEPWGKEQLAFLRRLLPCRHGVPSHDALPAARAASRSTWSLLGPPASAWCSGRRR